MVLADIVAANKYNIICYYNIIFYYLYIYKILYNIYNIKCKFKHFYYK